MMTGMLAAVMVAGSCFTAYADTPVIGAGMSGRQSSGPGVSGAGTGTALPERTDYFKAQVANPVVVPTEKYSYEEMVQDLKALQERYGSDRLRTRVIGTSLDGREIYEAVIGNENAEDHILITAGMHAREYMMPLLVMKQLEYGLEFASTGTYEGVPLSRLLDQVAIHYVPMVNPDGITVSQFGVGAIRSKELRQVIRQSYADDVACGYTTATFEQYQTFWKGNARGVDLNLNFPADWALVESREKPSFVNYRGTSALSEPESQTLAGLVNERMWKASISFHSMGNVIYWDNAKSSVSQWSGELAQMVSASNGYHTAAGGSGRGGFNDWTQSISRPIPGMTIEVGTVACPLPFDQWTDAWYRNKMVWAAVAKYVTEH